MITTTISSISHGVYQEQQEFKCFFFKFCFHSCYFDSCFQDGGKLDDSSDRITITDKYLEIKDLIKEDHGKYECRAINTIATVVSVTELRIDSE